MIQPSGERGPVAGPGGAEYSVGPAGARLPARAAGYGNVPYVLGAGALSVVVSHVPVVNEVVYPFRLMATFAHESSHAVVAVLTGGQVADMVINSDLSGVTRIWGGAALLIDSAGYVGTALVGAVLLLLPVRAARATLWTLAALACLAVVSFHVSLYTAFWGGVFAVLCGVAAAKASARIAALVQSIVAVQFGINALTALQVLGVYTVAGDGASDATNAAQASFLPPLFWTAVWTALAIALLGAALWHMARRDLLEAR
ncbi:MAG: hypothetical protein NVSMB65_11540 [Chloroflexota bacterium]